ncbi:uncharacterized protein [Palaemon carinicauda]|uniref:uncharacterized protein n=1 Tax=Palaemon carinicauda TaxID=392227 RepID=UPI0035B69DE4
MADAEHLINDKEDDFGGVSEGSEEVESDKCILVGKAIRVYNALEEGVALDYLKDKSLVLKAYDLVPDAYRLRFCSFNKHPALSFVEFAHIKEEQFDDWLKSRQVVTIAAFRKLLLLKEFKKACSRELRVHLEEIKASKLSNATHLADEYELTHRSSSCRFSYEMSNNPSVRTPKGGGRGDTSLSSPHIPRNNVNPNSFSGGYSRITELAVVDSLSIPGIDGILGNDMLDGESWELFPIFSVNACPVAITTLSAARAANLLDGDNDDDLLLSSIELDVERPGSVESSGSDVVNPFNFVRAAFIKAQKNEFNYKLGDVDDLTKPRFEIVKGHLGMLKAFHSLARYFWWPGLKMSVKQCIRECETCQVMGKPNQCIPKAPLHPIPAIDEPFSELVIDVNKALPFALFAIRSHTNSSTGVALFEFAFGQKVRGHLKIMFEVLKSSQKGEIKVGGLGEDLRSWMMSSWKFARENLKLSQSRMKENFDKKIKVRSFKPGELVLVLSMEPDCFLERRYKGPWKVLRKLSDVNYEVESPGLSRNCKVFHSNRIKPYASKRGDPLVILCEPVLVVIDVPPEESDDLVCQVTSDALGENMQNLELLTGAAQFVFSNWVGMLGFRLTITSSWIFGFTFGVVCSGTASNDVSELFSLDLAGVGCGLPAASGRSPEIVPGRADAGGAPLHPFSTSFRLCNCVGSLIAREEACRETESRPSSVLGPRACNFSGIATSLVFNKLLCGVDTLSEHVEASIDFMAHYLHRRNQREHIDLFHGSCGGRTTNGPNTSGSLMDKYQRVEG